MESNGMVCISGRSFGVVLEVLEAEKVRNGSTYEVLTAKRKAKRLQAMSVELDRIGRKMSH